MTSMTFSEAADYLERHRAEEAEAKRRAALELAEYHVLAAYDLKRFGRYGDMARSRRAGELNRRADRLIAAGVELTAGEFPASSADELRAAFERVGRPRVRRLIRETSLWTSADGRYQLDRRTKYNGTSLDVWRELERELGLEATR